MTFKEYQEAVFAIDAEANAKKKELARSFALEHNNVHVGDVIEDHAGKIRVEEIKVIHGSIDRPQCVYVGAELTKAGQPFKKNTRRSVWQCNLRKPT